MRTDLTKVNLLATSSANDLRVSKGVVKATGLNDMRLADIISIDIRKQQDEVQAVWTIGGVTPTITAATKYILKVGNTGKKYEGGQDQFRTYAYTSPATLSGTPAVDRQDVYDKLSALINGDASADWTANAGSGGTGMTITDKAGYYKAGRRGQASVFAPANSEGTGFIQATHLVETTAAVYAFGVGADLILKTPIIDPLTGNVISTEQELVYAELGAVSGQDYNAVFFASLVRANFSSIAGESYLRHNQVLFVDNGAGTSTANAAGYAAFELEAEKVLASQYADDSASSISFFGTAGVTSSTDGGIAADGDVNVYLDGETALHYKAIGVNTELAPSFAAPGLDLFLDETDNLGVQYFSPKSFVVGAEAFSFKLNVTLADVSGSDEFAAGFRLGSQAPQATLNGHSDLAVLSSVSGNVFAKTRLNGAGATATDTTFDWADTEAHTLEVRVGADGAVTYAIDGTVQTAAPAFSFDAGDEVVPFLFALNDADVAEGSILNSWVAVAGIEAK